MPQDSRITGTVNRRDLKGGARWYIRIDYGPDERGGRTRRYTGESFPTERAARRRLHELLVDANRRPRTDPARRTVGDLLLEWLEQDVVPARKGKTIAGYESVVRVHLIPAFGPLEARRLTTARIGTWRAQRQGEGMSTQMLAKATLHLGQAYTYGIRHGYLHHNPVAALARLRHEHREMRIWSPHEVAAFLDVAAAHSYHPLWHLAVYTGLREGELIALQWPDLDLEAGLLRVRRSWSVEDGEVETKNRRARTVDLDPDLVAVLRAWRPAQLQQKVKAGAHWSAAWREKRWLCTSEVGTMISPFNCTRALHLLERRAGVPAIRFHDLRHTCASIMLARGVPMHVVSRQLGHRDPSVTARVYAHLLDGQGKAAAAAFAGALREARDGRARSGAE